MVKIYDEFKQSIKTYNNINQCEEPTMSEQTDDQVMRGMKLMVVVFVVLFAAIVLIARAMVY